MRQVAILSEQATKWLAISGLVLGTFFLSCHVPTTFAFDKPLLSYSVLLLSITLTVIACGRICPSENGRTIKGPRDDALPVDEPGKVEAPEEARHSSAAAENVTYPSSLRKLRILNVTLAGAIILRAKVFHYVLSSTQCAQLTWEPLIPFVLGCLDYWRRPQGHKETASNRDSRGVFGLLEHYFSRSQYRYLVTVGLISIASLVSIAATRGPRSTYICAESQCDHRLVPLLQRTGTGLDVIIAYSVAQLLHGPDQGLTRDFEPCLDYVGRALLQTTQLSAGLLFTIGLPYYIWFASPSDKDHINHPPGYYLWSLLKLDVLFCATAVCALLAILHLGLTTVSIISALVLTWASSIGHAWNNTFALPPSAGGLEFPAFGLTILGFVLYVHAGTYEHRAHGTGKALFKRIPILFYVTILIICFVRSALYASQKSSTTYHPINVLTYDARHKHEAYVRQASKSSTLAEAVQIYRERYNKFPPPGFDHWYRYATEREAVVIDDFDSVYNDLLPFYALSPHTIRQRTWDLVSNRWQDANALLIRNGSVAISDTVADTHRWMLEGVTKMISNFAEHLPDMDLAFNANDEPRIIVPFESIEAMRQMARGSTHRMGRRPKKAFSAGRAEQWLKIPKDGNPVRLMEEHSWQSTFYNFGNVACPPGSPAREQRRWNLAELCTSCAKPHSMGPFLANWTKSADICHQPDIADLHGLYISPSAFKVSRDLYPIFSQSKVHGFNDILYPSAWNYMDKIKYDPNDKYRDESYSAKKNTLFWRGATSEGFSPGKGQWQGMTRQRLVHLSRDSGTVSPQNVLLPHSPDETPERLEYKSVAISDLTNVLSTDIHFAEVVRRCDLGDCQGQDMEFSPFVKPAEFQEHWKYKYLLDLDGAGFSGRFIPFLSSHSLPFRAALFREWWDDRLTAWHHFVPLDLRGHGLWATLAYFAGIEGRVNGKHVKIEPHVYQGERIAENGRAWVNKALRKEDMEIYMFRLLLEWGRLTDDRRDSLGFDIDAG